jgi:hypothetical protein
VIRWFSITYHAGAVLFIKYFPGYEPAEGIDWLLLVKDVYGLLATRSGQTGKQEGNRRAGEC